MGRKDALLLDIKYRINKIRDFLGDSSFENANEKTQAAVIMYLQVISETVRKLKEARENGKIDPNFAISNERKIISLRNRISHSYTSIDETIISQIVKSDLPALYQEIDQLITSDPENTSDEADFWE